MPLKEMIELAEKKIIEAYLYLFSETERLSPLLLH